MWDLPRPGLEPMSPALAGGFLTTAPPGKSLVSSFVVFVFLWGVLNHRNTWLRILALPFPFYPCMKVLVLPTASCPRNISGRDKPCGQSWVPVMEVSRLGLLGLLGVAPGSVCPLKPKCPHLLPLSWSKWRRIPHPLLTAPSVPNLHHSGAQAPSALCLFPLRTSNTTRLSQWSSPDVFFKKFLLDYSWFTMLC